MEVILILLLIIWVLVLPIVLPIVFGVKYRHIKKHLLELYQSGEITEEQYFFCVGKKPPLDAKIQDTESQSASQSEKSSAPEKEAHSGSVPSTELDSESSSGVELDVKTEITADSMPQDSAPATSSSLEETSDKEEIAADSSFDETSEESAQDEIAADVSLTETSENSENAGKDEDKAEKIAAREAQEQNSETGSSWLPIPVILGLGVVLICTAGAAFISSFWGGASALLKLIAVGSFSLIFYGAFRLSHNKLQIPNSAKAFYILFVAALGTAVTAAEILDVFLGDLSTAGSMLLPVAVIAAGMFRGFAIFKSRLFPILGTLFVLLFLTALSTLIFDDSAMMFFIPSGVSTGVLAFSLLNKKKFAVEARKPAIVLFIVFTSLLMLSTFALEDAFNKNLITAFALSLAILMHIQMHKSHSLFVECAIPVALCWAAILFNYSISTDSRPIALYACHGIQCISIVGAFLSLRRKGRSTHPIALCLYALSIVCVAIYVYGHAQEQGFEWFIPALVFMILGAHLMQVAHTKSEQTIGNDAKSEKDKSDGGKHVAINKVFESHPRIASWIGLCAGGIFTLCGYGFVEVPSRHIWMFNLMVSLFLIVIALVPARFGAGEQRSRRYTVFVLQILLTLGQFIQFDSGSGILEDYPLNQMIFLAPAFVLAIIERFDALKNERREFALTAHIAWAAIVLWAVALIMLMLNEVLSCYLVLGMKVNPENYIFPVDALLLTAILFYKSKTQLYPKTTYFRLISGVILLAVSYITFNIEFSDHDYYHISEIDPVYAAIIRMIPWVSAEIYLSIILFYTFRKKMDFSDAPHLRLRTAIGLTTLMALVQIPYEVRLAAVLFFAPLALDFLDDRRGAALQKPNAQTLAAAIGSALFFALVAILAVNMDEVFSVGYATRRTFQTYVLPGLALICALVVLAEHLVMRLREKRPYRLVAAVDLEITSACALIYLLDNWHSGLTIRLLLLAAGLIGTWCMSRREHRKYGAFAAISVFVGIFAVLETAWDGLDTTKPAYLLWIATAVIVAMLAFVDGFKRVGYTHLRAVWAIAAIPLVVVHNDPWHIAHVAGVLILALNLLQYLRDRGQSDHDRALMTISGGIIAVALALKILLLPEDSWFPMMPRPELVFLIPVAAAYLLTWRVWKFRSVSHDVSSLCALVGLPLVYVLPDTHVQFHAITVTVCAIVAIVVATRLKLSRYLAIGILSIVVIFFSQTRNFWYSLHWWVYLAVVGVLLLVIAVVNEMERRRGSTLVQRAKGLRDRAWKW